MHDQEELDALAEEAGVVSWRQMRLREGRSHRSAVHLRATTGRRVHRGVHVLAGLQPLDPYRRALAAVASAGPDAVPSHLLAAALLGLWEPPAAGAPAVVTRPRPRRGHRDLDVRVGHVLPEDLVAVHRPDGEGVLPAWSSDVRLPSCRLLVTSHLRTVADLAGDEERIIAVHAGERLLRRGMTLPPSLVERHPLLAACDVRSESPLETRARLVLTAAGLPPTTLQHEVVDPRTGRRVYVDLAYLGPGGEPRVAVETDGTSVHSAPDALYRDRWKQQLLEEHGFVVRRITWRDLELTPGDTVAGVRWALARAAGRAAA